MFDNYLNLSPKTPYPHFYTYGIRALVSTAHIKRSKNPRWYWLFHVGKTLIYKFARYHINMKFLSGVIDKWDDCHEFGNILALYSWLFQYLFLSVHFSLFTVYISLFSSTSSLLTPYWSLLTSRLSLLHIPYRSLFTHSTSTLLTCHVSLSLVHSPVLTSYPLLFTAHSSTTLLLFNPHL